MTSLPAPDLDPQPIAFEEFMELIPEKFELAGGYLFDSPQDHRLREPLLAILLANEGLIRTVRLAPLERWLEALRRAYGEIEKD